MYTLKHHDNIIHIQLWLCLMNNSHSMAGKVPGEAINKMEFSRFLAEMVFWILLETDGNQYPTVMRPEHKCWKHVFTCVFRCFSHSVL